MAVATWRMPEGLVLVSLLLVMTYIDVCSASTVMVSVGDIHISMNKIGSISTGRYESIIDPEDPYEVNVQVDNIVIKDNNDDTRKSVYFGKDPQKQKFSIDDWQSESYKNIPAQARRMFYEIPEMGTRLFVDVNAFVRSGTLPGGKDVKPGDVHITVGLKRYIDPESCTLCDVYDHISLKMTVTSAEFGSTRSETVPLAGGAAIFLPYTINSDGMKASQPVDFPVKEVMDGMMDVYVYLSKFRSNVTYGFLVQPAPVWESTTRGNFTDSPTPAHTEEVEVDDRYTLLKGKTGGQQSPSDRDNSARHPGTDSMLLCLCACLLYLTSLVRS